MRHHLKHAADRIAGAIGFVHHGFHLFFDRGIDAAEQDFGLPVDGAKFLPACRAIEPHRTDGDHMAEDLDAERGE